MVHGSQFRPLRTLLQAYAACLGLLAHVSGLEAEPVMFYCTHHYGISPTEGILSWSVFLF